MNAQTRDDQINLVDLITVVYERRWLIVGGLLLGALLMGALGYFTPPKYEYRSIVELGRLPDNPLDASLLAQQRRTSRPQRNYELIELPEDAAARLQAFAYEILYSRIRTRDVELVFSIEDDFAARAVKGAHGERTALVEARLRSPGNDDAAEFVRLTTTALVEVHQKEADDHKRHLEINIERLQHQLVRKRAFKDSLSRAVEGLDSESETIRSRIEDAENRLQALSTIELESTSRSVGDPIALLLLNNEIQIHSHIDNLRTQLFTGIPDRESQLRLSLDQIESEISDVEGKLDVLRSAIHNTTATRFIVSPDGDGERVGSNLGLYVVLGTFAGCILALLLAFVLEFWKNNRARITIG